MFTGVFSTAGNKSIFFRPDQKGETCKGVFSTAVNKSDFFSGRTKKRDRERRTGRDRKARGRMGDLAGKKREEQIGRYTLGSILLARELCT